MNRSQRSAFILHVVPLSISRSTYSPPPQYASRRWPTYACAASPSIDKLLNAARHDLSHTGLEITSMQWTSRVLTLYVKRDNGQPATADDCADVSTLVEEVIEQQNFLGDAPYTLQVSTPGAAHVLTHQHEFDAFRGFPVRVETTEPVNGKKEFWGTLAECNEEIIRIAVKGRIAKLSRDIVNEIRLCTAQQVQEGLSKT